MKLHLPVRLRKAVFACFSVVSVCTLYSGGIVAAADLTLAEADSLAVDYADSSSITDLSGGTLTLAGGTKLLLTNCGEGDGKTYTLFTGVSSLLDAEGNTLTLTDENKAVSLYFDTTQPGTGFWAGGWLQLAPDGTMQLVLHGEEVREALTITTRQTGSKTYNYYEGVCFRDITYTTSGSSSACGGAIYDYSGITTLSNNGSVTFSGNTASSGSVFAYGGAIYGARNYDITLSDNGSVTFSGNTVSSSSGAYGGAIYGRPITLSHNGSVAFSGNTASASSSSSSYSGADAYASGGAIDGGPITLSHNGSVTFSGNTASGTDYAHGGAIDGDTITLSHNGSVTFSGNTASGSYNACGGAIYGGTIMLSNNGSVTFSGNTTSGSDYAGGGAIHMLDGSPLKINNNGETIFRGNYAHSTAYGVDSGAIYKEYGIFSIQNNASVVFEKNYTLSIDTLRLQSIYAYDLEYAGKEMLVNFSAPEGGKIEFRDSIDIDVDSNSASAFHLNNWYVNDAGEKVAQTGDIIFTGEDATAENLKAILAEHGIHREATAGEIQLSKTSKVWGIMQLHDGRLIVRDGAIIRADGITVHGSASGESTPTLWLDNGELSSYWTSNSISIAEGSAMRLSGQNTARDSTLSLSAGSTLIIDVAAAHTTTAALTLNSSTLTLGGTITLRLNAAEGLNTADRYMLLSGVSAPTDWANRISVSGGVWTIDDLSWVNNTLYLNFPTLTEATWNNQSGDRLWNVNSSFNWEQHDIDYAYKDGIGVIFGDEGAGKVTLVGTLTPASVLVNSTGNYSFEGSGSLRGGMTLTKQGSGTLSISTANSYTGGTMIEAGTVVAKHAAALGTGPVTLAGGTLEIAVTGVGNTIANTGTSTLKVAGDITHILTGTIANSGELTLTGNFDASKLDKSDSTDVYVDVLGNETADGSGFTRSGDFTVSIANGTVDSTGASVSYKGTPLEMTGGVGLSKGGMLWGEYRILSGHEVELSAIVNKAAENQVSSTNIQLNGGKLTANRALTGTLSISGTSALHGVDFNLGNAPLQNSGDLTLTGSFDASGLSKTKTWNSYVTTSNEVSSDGSGFLREGDFEVTVVTGTGTVDSSGVTAMKYGCQNLTMNGAIGSGVGEMQYDTYRILSGHEVDLSAIVDKAAENQVSMTDIQLNGGKLTADRALTGTLSISGTSALHGVDFDLGNAPLQNSGDLKLTGSFDASGLSKTKTWNSYVTTSNEVSTDGSGFLRKGDFEVTVVTGSGTVASSGVTAMEYGGQSLTMNGAIGSGVGEMHYDTYRILSGHTANSSAIHGYDEGEGKNALITLADGGTLNADDAATETKVNATGGSINLSAGTLSGTVGGSTAVAVTGTATMSGDNSYTGGTTLNGATLTVTHANALGTGAICSTDDSRLTVEGTDPLVLSEVISNATDGELTLEGAFDASALEYHIDSDGRIDLDGNDVANTASGFAKDVRYWVQIVDGGTTLGTRTHISHREHLSRQPLVLGSDGVASTGGFTDYTHFRLEGDDSFSVSEIAGAAIRQAGVELLGVTMRSGELTVDKSVAVNAEGGSIVLSTPAVTGENVKLNGTIADTAVSSLPGAYDSIISATMEGTSSLTVGGGTISVSGVNSYSGGTSVNGGTLVAGSDTAFGSGDVAVNDGGTLDLGACTIANLVLLSGEATLAHADGASNILLQSGANAGFANGFELSEGKSLTVGAGMAAFVRSRAARVGGTVYRGALTLGGGELTLNEHLTVEGHVSFGAGTTTIVNVAGWQGAEAGTELAIFNSNSGYTMDSLTLRGAATGLVLNFNASTGVLSLVAAQQQLPPAPPPVLPEFAPDLNRNQQEVYDTVKDIVAGGEKPEGELGKLVELISGSRNEAELRELLDAVGGSEYATLMSNQLDGNLAHLRNLRNRMGSGWELVGNNYMRAMIEMFGQHSEVDGDAHGRGYTRSEMGGQFTLEFIGCMHMSSGVALASGHTRLTPDKAMRQTVNNNYVDFYTTYRSHGHRNMGYSAKFSLGIGTHDYNLRRNVLGTPTKADTDGFSLNFMHESAYTVRLSQGSSLQIFGVVESSFSRVKGFREKGAGTASLVMETQDAWATDITLGLRYVQMLDSFALPQATLTLQTGVTAGVGDTTAAAQLHFAGAPRNRYYQTGADRNRWGYNLGVGLHVPVSDTSAFYMNGETILRGDSAEWNANVGFQIAF